MSERDKDTPPLVPNSPRLSATGNEDVSEICKDVATLQAAELKATPPPPRVEAEKDDATGDKATPTARPRPPPPRAILCADKPEGGDKSLPTSHLRPPPPKVTSQLPEITLKLRPLLVQGQRSSGSKTTPSAPEKNDDNTVFCNNLATSSASHVMIFH